MADIRSAVRRVIWIVLDSVGVGAMPDAAEFGAADVGSDTLGNIARKVGNFDLPNLRKLGLAEVSTAFPSAPPLSGEAPFVCYGRSALGAPNKDTTSGHWEMTGVILDCKLPTFPNGFPPEVMDRFESEIELETIGNCVASGTEIIKELGEEHVRTRKPIVYTSADSVFQVAMHEKVIPLKEQYKICQIAREILKPPYRTARVICRPFIGDDAESFERTMNRKDFSVTPPKSTLLDNMSEEGHPVYGLGKIGDIFCHHGLNAEKKIQGNTDGMKKILKVVYNDDEHDLFFANLVDFDSKYGHRNDFEGYAEALKEVDEWIPSLLNALRDDDLLILNADHGCDPTTDSTDHSREYTPLLIHCKKMKQNIDLGTRASLADTGRTVGELFDSAKGLDGTSFLDELERSLSESNNK